MIKKTDRLLSLVACFIVICFFACFAIINYIGLPHFIDGDMYADMLFARHAWEEKTLFPEGWVFSNQYYVAATPVICALFYGLTGSINLSLALATSVMSVFIIISFFYMLRPFVKEQRNLIFALLALLASLIAPNAMGETSGQLFFTQASYYACYLITLFVCTGDYLRSIGEEKLFKRPAVLTLCALLSFAMGMQSLRQTLIMVMPLIFIELLLTLWRAIRKEKAFNKASLLRVGLYTIFNLAGYLLASLMKIPTNTLYNTDEAVGNVLINKLTDIWHCISYITGFDFLHGDFSKLVILPFAFFVGTVIVAFILIVKKLKDGIKPMHVLWLALATGICAVFAAGLVLDISIRPIYIFMWYPLTAVSLVIVLESMTLKKGRAYIIMLCLISIWTFNFDYGKNLKKAVEPLDNDMQEIIAYCRENDIKYAYGQWNSASRFAAATDGDITGAFWDDYYFYIVPFNNEPNVYSEEDNTHAIYLVYHWDAPYVEQYAIDSGEEMSCIGVFDGIYAYRCTGQLMKNFG